MNLASLQTVTGAAERVAALAAIATLTGVGAIPADVGVPILAGLVGVGAGAGLALLTPGQSVTPTPTPASSPAGSGAATAPTNPAATGPPLLGMVSGATGV